MLRKRTGSLQKDQQMDQLDMSESGSQFQSDHAGHQHKTSFLFSVPGLFVGLSPKGLSDCDAVRSPTSPLEMRVFSNVGNSHMSPRSPQIGHQKSWDCDKVGLSIVDSLDDVPERPGKVLRSSESKNILFGPQARINAPNSRFRNDSFDSPKSLPRNFAIFPCTLAGSPLQGNSDVLFEIGDAPSEPESFGKIRSCSLDSCRSFSTLSRFTDCNSKVISENLPLNNVTTQVGSSLQFSGGSSNLNNCLHTNLTSAPMYVGSGYGFVGSLSASEIELSEDYTCVISHGPNPKKTHIYGDCILECHSDDLSNFGKNEHKENGVSQAVSCSMIPSPFPSSDFLSFCYCCHKKLEDGKDIYIYRGEKAFCSSSCRLQEIMIDEELEKTVTEDSPKSYNSSELLEAGIFDAP